MKLPRHAALTIVALAAVAVSSSPRRAIAQVPVVNYGGVGLGLGGMGYGSPVRSMSSQIRAYNRMMRYYGGGYGSNGRYGNYGGGTNPFLTQIQIANSVAYVKAYYQMKAIHETERAKRHIEPLDREKLKNSKTWGWLKDHPEMTVRSIIEGKAQNFLLHRLANTMLAMHISADDQGPEADLLKQLKLDPETLHQLQLRQDLPNGEGLIFRADEGTALSNDWWPYILRGDDFSAQRLAFDKARQAARQEARQGTVSNDTLDHLMKTVADICAAFEKHFDKNTRLKSPQNFQRYLTTERFLQSLAGEVTRMQSTGDGSAFDGSLKFQAGDLISLLGYMCRHGLEFAPAKPGDEAGYQTVFRMMRDIYVSIADDDDSIHPKKTPESIIKELEKEAAGQTPGTIPTPFLLNNQAGQNGANGQNTNKLQNPKN